VTHWNLMKDRGYEQPLDPLSWEDQPEIVAELQDWFRLIDSGGLCNFMFYLGMDEDQLRDLIEAATGMDMGGHRGLLRIGARIFNLEVLFNRRAGVRASEDTLPPRMLDEPLPDGPGKGYVVHLAEMLPPYYAFRGWDERGDLTPEKAAELGLESELAGL